jgi:SAM-dependent methyltransferase
MSTFHEFERRGWEDADLCSAYHDRLGRVVVQVVEPMLDAVRVGSADRVLDVATGSGVVAAAAARRGADVVGVDFSEQQLRWARHDHPGLSFEQGEADALPFAAESFEVVLSNFGVPHFPDPGAYFREAWRVLRQHGRLGFAVWAPPARANGFDLIYSAIARHGSFDVGLPPGPDFFLFADADTARDTLAAAGFDGVSATTVPQVWELPRADALMDSVLHGTVRAAAVLDRQTPEALDRIRASIREAMAPYAGADGVHRVPMPAVLVTATKAPPP